MNINFQSNQQEISGYQGVIRKIIDGIKSESDSEMLFDKRVIEMEERWGSQKKALLYKCLSKHRTFTLIHYIHTHNRNKEKAMEVYNKIKAVSHMISNLLVFEDLVDEGKVVLFSNAIKESIERNKNLMQNLPEYYWK
jgi:hypothetical protein